MLLHFVDTDYCTFLNNYLIQFKFSKHNIDWNCDPLYLKFEWTKYFPSNIYLGQEFCICHMKGKVFALGQSVKVHYEKESKMFQLKLPQVSKNLKHKVPKFFNPPPPGAFSKDEPSPTPDVLYNAAISSRWGLTLIGA